MQSFIFGLFGLGTPEIIAIMVVILILFGARKIPQFARGIGQGIREFKDASNGVTREIDGDDNTNSSQAQAQAKPTDQPSTNTNN